MNRLSNLAELVQETLERLLYNNGSTTTLEIKNTLREAFPNTKWTQLMVSGCVDCIYRNKILPNLIYQDTGNYRIYTISELNQTVTQSALCELVHDAISDTNSIEISFKTSRGQDRTYVCTVQAQNALGYYLIATDDGIKTVRPSSIYKVRVDHKTYERK